MPQQKKIKETQPFCSLTLTKALTENWKNKVFPNFTKIPKEFRGHKSLKTFRAVKIYHIFTEKRLLYKLAIKCIAVLHILNDGR